MDLACLFIGLRLEFAFFKVLFGGRRFFYFLCLY